MSETSDEKKTSVVQTVLQGAVAAIGAAYDDPAIRAYVRQGASEIGNALRATPESQPMVEPAWPYPRPEPGAPDQDPDHAHDSQPVTTQGRTPAQPQAEASNVSNQPTTPEPSMLDRMHQQMDRIRQAAMNKVIDKHKGHEK